MKRAIIVHCWNGFPEYAWYSSVKTALERADFKVDVPEMSDTNAPKLNLWLDKLVEVIGTPDSELFLVGHSVGAVTILRYLETLPENVVLGGVVLVAGFIDDIGYPELENFFDSPLDFERIRKKAKKFVFIHSDNDPYVPLKHGEVLKEKLNGQLIIKEGMKHFAGPEIYKENCTDLPDVVSAVLASSSSL